jgi:hypothetical protein
MTAPCRFERDDTPTQTYRRYCRLHAERVYDYLQRTGLIVRVVKA